ncbi:type II secretion system F family protein [Tautonia plasticadhaerens]|uniref:Type II secretion system protein F n=1 Tax=Tautonia plasticadhaerens TaxID=2527974 RepID=A0A518GWV0_9BACT|nr:type II secretion system F family protein [Tautonia plasticadhaerens]QDV33042.1 Putative type II secretion system protein F [Tautonia plasticadhaerens]
MAIGGGAGRLALEDLIALNDEIAALVRAGVPLERGLVGTGRDLRGRLGKVADAVGRRMEAEGCSLGEALEAEAGGLPELYRAAVAAGIRSGRLPAALEGLSTFARSLADLRRAIGLALIYPAIVLVFAFGLFLTFVVVLAPGIDEAFASLGAPPGAAARLARLGESAAIWGPIAMGVIALGFVAWVRSGRASMIGEFGPIRWIPGMRGLVDQARGGMLAELLAILIENRVPLPDALSLASRAVGDERLRALADHAAESARLGGSPGTAPPPELGRSFPPMLRWALLGGHARGDLPESLRLAARTYRERAAARADLIRLVVPTALLVVLGGGAVLLYGLTLFVPFSQLLRGVSL